MQMPLQFRQRRPPLTALPQVRLLLHAPPGTRVLVQTALRAACFAPAGAAWPVCRAALLGEPLWAALVAHDAAAAVADPVRGWAGWHGGGCALMAEGTPHAQAGDAPRDRAAGGPGPGARRLSPR